MANSQPVQEQSPPTDNDNNPLQIDEGVKAKPAEREISLDEPFIAQGVDILASQGIDPALEAKMYIVNNVRIFNIPKEESRRLTWLLQTNDIFDMTGYRRDWIYTLSLETVCLEWIWVKISYIYVVPHLINTSDMLSTHCSSFYSLSFPPRPVTNSIRHMIEL